MASPSRAASRPAPRSSNSSTLPPDRRTKTLTSDIEADGSRRSRELVPERSHVAVLRPDSPSGTVQSGETVDNSRRAHVVVESDKGIRRCGRCGFQTRSGVEAEYHERWPLEHLVERVRKLERTR